MLSLFEDLNYLYIFNYQPTIFSHLSTRAILTNMLPSFRLTGSEEDLHSNPDYDQSASRYLDDQLPSPSKYLAFKLDATPSTELPGDCEWTTAA